MAPKTPAKDKILEAAARLFYVNGITATGVDTITAEAGVARMSLYNNFASKDEVIESYIRARHDEWLSLYRSRLEQANTPRDRVQAVFLAYRDHASSAFDHGFRGCGLLNAAAELPAGSPGREAVREHKEEVESIIAEHVVDAGMGDAAGQIAEHLSLLLEGAVTRAGLEGTPDLIDRAMAISHTLLPDVPLHPSPTS